MPKKKKNNKFYAVAAGRLPGIYQSWDDCKKQTHGFQGAKFKSFATRQEAQAFMVVVDSSSTSSSSTSSSSASKADRTRAPKVTTTPKAAPATIKEETKLQPVPSKRRRNSSSSSSEKNQTTISVHFDGGSRGNPGLGGAGAHVVVSVNQEVKRTIDIRAFCGHDNVTNNQAEYQGLLSGLEQVLEQLECMQQQQQQQSNHDDGTTTMTCDLQVRGDSDLIIQQLKGRYQVKSPKLQPFFQNVQEVLSKIRNLLLVTVEITFAHVYRDKNKIADGLANEAMDEKRSWKTVVEASSSSAPAVADANVKTTTAASEPVAKRCKANMSKENFQQIYIHFSGSRDGGIGGAGAQLVVVDDKNGGRKEIVHHIRTFCGYRTVTNHQAEYQGLLSGLAEALVQIKNINNKPAINGCCCKLVICGDSEVVMKQMQDETNHPVQTKLVSLHRQVKAAVSKIRDVVVDPEVVYEHISREANIVANGLAKEAMSEKRSWKTTEVSSTESNSTIITAGKLNNNEYDSDDGGINV